MRMMEVMKALKPCYAAKLILVGKFSSDELKNKIFEFIAKYDLHERIIYKGFLPHKDTLLELSAADIGLFLISNRERYRWGEPIKYFEYSASGLPVIMSDLPAKKALLEKNDNGIAVSSENIDQTVKAIAYLIQNPAEAQKMSENGHKAFLNRYNWESIEHRLLDLYDQLL
jgi:glycosyltransferase involved in cell wall biosynthesis